MPYLKIAGGFSPLGGPQTQMSARGNAALVGHKLVVRTWNANRNGRERAGCDGSCEKEARIAADGRRMQWIRQQAMPPTSSEEEVLCAPTKLVGLGNPALAHQPRDVESHPTTVSQVRRAYRERARRVDEARELRLVDHREQHRQSGGFKRTIEPLKTKGHCEVRTPDEREGGSAGENSSESPVCDGSSMYVEELVLPPEMLLGNADGRADLRRQLRSALSSGRDVHLVVPLAGASDRLAELKFSLQQLCTDSLLFCARDQDVVPSVDAQRNAVAFKLLARHPAARMGSLGLC